MRLTCSLILLSCCVSTHSAPNASHLEQSILEFTHKTFATQYPDARVTVTVAPLNPVLEQKECPRFSLLAPEHLNPGPVSIKVECVDWSFYTRTQVDLQVHAVVPKQLIERGKRITAADVIQAWVPLKHVSQAFLTNPSDAIDKVAHRTITVGRPIKARDLHTPYSVARGDRVVIHAKLGAAHITTSGIALQNGRIGEQIPVQNERSERVIRPWVVAPGTVSTRPNAT